MASTTTDDKKADKPTGPASGGSKKEKEIDGPSDISKEFELPMASVTRILKKRMPEGVTISKEAKTAFSKSAGIFILYLTAAANEYCMDEKRQTLNSRDIFDALKSLGFEDFIGPLQEYLVSLRIDTKASKPLSSVNGVSPAESIGITPGGSSKRGPGRPPGSTKNKKPTEEVATKNDSDAVKDEADIKKEDSSSSSTSPLGKRPAPDSEEKNDDSEPVIKKLKTDGASDDQKTATTKNNDDIAKSNGDSEKEGANEDKNKGDDTKESAMES